MYTQLLGAALKEVSFPDGVTTTAEAVAELNRRRDRLEDYGSREGTDWAGAAVADELAYDIALIELARRFGGEYDVSDFENPGKGRTRLVRYLQSQGVVLGARDPETQPCQGR